MGIREWHPEQGFPTARQMARMAAEVRARVESAMQREGERAARRKRLRDVYRRHSGEGAKDVDFGAVRNLVENAAAATFAAWRGVAQLDHIALAEAGTREDFDDLEFLINRGLGELNGLKNAVTLARRPPPSMTPA